MKESRGRQGSGTHACVGMHGCMDVWVCVGVCARMYGCMGIRAWVYGRGCMALWIYVGKCMDRKDLDHAWVYVHV